MTDRKSQIQRSDRIHALVDELEEARGEYLRAAGWKHTSSTPGCFWLWERVLPDGRHVLTDLEFAVQMQRHLDPPEDGHG